MSAPPRAGPSAEAIAAADEFVIEELGRDFDLIASLATSGVEASWRGDRAEIRLRLRQVGDCLRHAGEIHDLLSPEPPKESGS
jgi:hypothetical protein